MINGILLCKFLAVLFFFLIFFRSVLFSSIKQSGWFEYTKYKENGKINEVNRNNINNKLRIENSWKSVKPKKRRKMVGFSVNC